MFLSIVMADVEQLAVALATQVADSLANLPQDAATNFRPSSPIVTSPPRVKQRVSEMSCFISGPQGAADSASVVDVEVAPTTLAQPSCFVQTSLLVPQVPDGFVETPRVVPRIQEVASSSASRVLPQVPLLPGSSSSPVDVLSQMRTMMDEVLTQKLTQQNRELKESFQSSIASVRTDLAEEKTERLAG